MIQTSLRYNPDTDLSPVSQYGALDLKDALKHNVIPGDLVYEPKEPNGFDDPHQVSGLITDVFEAERVKAFAHAAKTAPAPAEPSNNDPE